MSNDNVFDVTIVGYGPTGATLANLLGQAGHRVAVIDMFDDVFELPRAINIDHEVLRTWQAVGLAAEIAENCQPHTGTDFVGADGELIKYLYSAPPPYPLGWPANLMFVQPEAERALRRGVRRFDNVTEFLGYEARSVSQDSDGVTVAVMKDLQTTSIRSRWLVGCDGANSPIRTELGIGQLDLGFSESWIVVDAWLRRDTPLPPRTTQYCDPAAPGAYVICSGSLRRWEMKILDGEDPESYLDQNRVRQRMTHYVDPDALEFWRNAVYHFHARVTDRWRHGRIMLAGDAAHQMPPFLGQGLCSGVRDAANLAWKLSRVLRGQSTERLLDTYEQERKPHIRVLTEITKSLGEIVGETDPVRAQARDLRLRAEMNSGRMVTVRQSLIPPLSKGVLDPGDETGLAGTLAVQPVLEAGERRTLADDLSGPGFRVLTTTVPEDALSRYLADHDIAVVSIGAGQFQDVDGTFGAFVQAHGVESIFVRPDGYIWGAATSPQATAIAAHRLVESLQPLEVAP